MNQICQMHLTLQVYGPSMKSDWDLLSLSLSLSLSPSLPPSLPLYRRYITQRFLPDKAIDLMDEACARPGPIPDSDDTASMTRTIAPGRLGCRAGSGIKMMQPSVASCCRLVE